MTMTDHRKKLMAIIEIVKKRFPNLTVIEVTNFAYDVLEAVENSEK